MKKAESTVWDPKLLLPAISGSFRRLDPRLLYRNPVMLLVEIVSVIMTWITLEDLLTHGPVGFDFQITIWLWFTVLFATFAEGLAEGRGKAQAETLRATQSHATGRRLLGDGREEIVPAGELRSGDLVMVRDNELIPIDGEITEGVALVDESAITGESAPVVREAGGDRSGVTGGTRVLSGKIKIQVTANPGETFLDQMIGMVESAKRQKTPNEIALEILLIALSIVFITVTITLVPFAHYMSVSVPVSILISLLVCLMPTTIGGLLPAIGISGMDRLLRHNVIALSGRSVEAAGDVTVVMLDKTGTITLGNRMATEFIPSEGIDEKDLAEAAMLASLADDTPEGRSIVALAKERLGVRGRDIRASEGSEFVPFSAETRMSGIDMNGRVIRKGASSAVVAHVKALGGAISPNVQLVVDHVAREGCTPLVVSDGQRILGVIRLKDVLKQGIRERLSQLRRIGIRSVMITGDNPLTAAAIAAEAGIDDFIAQAKPAMKLERIRQWQADGNLVAMIGDGTNDAPALAQADVAVAMNAGTQAAREAANMVDLDSNPTKLLDIVEVGKQILITRGSLTTFSIANDVAKYFAIIPAIFAGKFPALNVLNIMALSTPAHAVLAAVIFNAIIIPLLIPLALRGVRYKAISPAAILQRNILIYGVGGVILPFAGIKLIDLLIQVL